LDALCYIWMGNKVRDTVKDLDVDGIDIKMHREVTSVDWIHWVQYRISVGHM
jgi:hypothetical protein